MAFTEQEKKEQLKGKDWNLFQAFFKKLYGTSSMSFIQEQWKAIKQGKRGAELHDGSCGFLMESSEKIKEMLS